MSESKKLVVGGLVANITQDEVNERLTKMSEYKRLFVGGLVAHITQDEVKERFARFGEVEMIEIKIKEDHLTGEKNTFAYVDMKLSQYNLNKCMKVYNHSKWKGKELRIQVAKESFIQRLQRERQTATEDSCLTEERQKIDGHDKVKNTIIKATPQGTPVENMRNWVVGKRGQILPIVYIRRNDQKKVVKMDPSRYIHNNKIMDDKSKGPSMEPLDISVEKLTWELEERKGKHMQDIARDSNWKPTKKSSTFRKNVASYGRINNGPSGTIDFNSDSGENATTNNYASSEDTDEMVSGQNAYGNRVKSQAKIKLQRAGVHRNSIDSSDDPDDMTSGEANSLSPKKRVKKASRDSRRKASISSSNYDSSGVSSGSDISEEEITSLPGWLESESDSEVESSLSPVTVLQNVTSNVSSSSKPSKIVNLTSKSSIKDTSFVVKPTVSGASCKQNAVSNALTSPKICSNTSAMLVDDESLPSSSSSSSDTDDMTERTLPSKTKNQAADTTSITKNNQMLAKKRSHDSSQQNHSSTKLSKVVQKNKTVTGILSVDNLVDRKHYNEALLDEFSSGFQQQMEESNSSCEEELDIFEMIESGKISNLSKNDSTSCNQHQTSGKLQSTSSTHVDKAKHVEFPKIPQNDKQKVPKKDNPVVPVSVSETTVKSNKGKKATSKTNVPCTAEKQKMSNQKRLDSLMQRRKENLLQKSAVQKALSSVDSSKTSNKKIVFDSDDEEVIEPATVAETKEINKMSCTLSKSNKEKMQLTTQKISKPKLFADDSGQSSGDDDSTDSDDDNDAQFKIRPEFQGKSGKKLLDRQSRYGNDSRFKVDARFIESSSESESESGEEEDPAMASMTAERDRALEILRTVIGSKGSRLKTQERKIFKDINALHYDPAQESHKQFELPEEETNKRKVSKKTEKTKVTRAKEEIPPPDLPKVSSEKFYDVGTSLKDLFVNNSTKEDEAPFSLLSSFGTADDQMIQQNVHDSNDFTTDKLPTTNSKFPWQQQPGYAESSDDDENENFTNLAERECQDADSRTSATSNNKADIFFLQLGHPDVQESIKFFTSPPDKDEMRAQWLETRPTLVDAYRMKRKHSLRQGRSAKKFMTSKRGRR